MKIVYLIHRSLVSGTDNHGKLAPESGVGRDSGGILL